MHTYTYTTRQFVLYFGLPWRPFERYGIVWIGLAIVCSLSIKPYVQYSEQCVYNCTYTFLPRPRDKCALQAVRHLCSLVSACMSVCVFTLLSIDDRLRSTDHSMLRTRSDIHPPCSLVKAGLTFPGREGMHHANGTGPLQYCLVPRAACGTP